MRTRDGDEPSCVSEGGLDLSLLLWFLSSPFAKVSLLSKPLADRPLVYRCGDALALWNTLSSLEQIQNILFHNPLRPSLFIPSDLLAIDVIQLTVHVFHGLHGFKSVGGFGLDLMGVFRTGGEAEETGFSASLNDGALVWDWMRAEGGFCLGIHERDSDLLLDLRPEFLGVTALVGGDIFNELSGLDHHRCFKGGPDFCHDRIP